MVQLQQLELEGFGKFAKKTKFDFSEGINFINGLNEAGKSTILEAILASLFKYTTKKIEPYFSWQNGDVCRLKLSYINDNNESFQIISDYKNDKKKLLKINKSSTSEISTKKTTIHNKVKEHFGFNEQKVFENTTFIRQSQMAILAKRDETVNKLKDMVEEVLVGTAEASATKSLKNLRKSVRAFNKELDQLKKKREQIAQELQDVEEKNSDVAKDSQEYKKVSEELPKKEKELKELQERKEKFDKKEELEKEQNNLNEKIDELNRAIININSEINEREKLKDKLKNYKGFDSLSENDFSRIKNIFDELSNYNSKNQRLKKAISMVQDYQSKNDTLNEELKEYKGYDTISKNDFSRINEIIKELDSLNVKNESLDKALSVVKDYKEKNKKLQQEMQKYKGYDSIDEKTFQEIKSLIEQIKEIDTYIVAHNKSGIKKETTIEKIDPLYVILFIIGLLFSIVLIGIPLAIYSYKKMKKQEVIEETDEDARKKIQEFGTQRNKLMEKLTDLVKEIKDFDRSNFSDNYSRYLKIKDSLDNNLKYAYDFIQKTLSEDDLENLTEENDLNKLYENLESRKNDISENINELQDELDNITKHIKNFDRNTFSDNYREYKKIKDHIEGNRRNAIEFVQKTLSDDDIKEVSKEISVEELKALILNEEDKADKNTKKLNDELKEITKHIKNFEPDEFIDSYNEYMSIKKEINAHTNTIHTLVKNELEESNITENEDENIKNVEYKKTNLSDEQRKVQNNLKEYKLINITDKEIKQLDELRKEVKDLNDKKIKLETNAKNHKKYVKDPEDLKEQLDKVDSDIEELQDKSEEHQLAADFLERAEQEVQQKFTPAIQGKSKPILKKITNDKYSDISINEENMNISIKAPEINDYVSVDLLSQGAKDQVYFTIRTAMTDLLSGDINIPLIFDDPFHNFDDIRLKETIDAIKEIAQKKQIILISHKNYQEAFNNFADKLIEVK